LIEAERCSGSLLAQLLAIHFVPRAIRYDQCYRAIVHDRLESQIVAGAKRDHWQLVAPKRRHRYPEAPTEPWQLTAHEVAGRKEMTREAEHQDLAKEVETAAPRSREPAFHPFACPCSFPI
jgi:hypothetical protein